MIDIEEINRPCTKIKVVGVGGGGCNAVNSMATSNLFGVELIAINTDKQALDISKAHQKIQIGEALTKGLGAGADPAVGREAAVGDKDAIVASIEGSDMLFITAGMGGGTGTGAAPVIASYAKELGILTVSIVTKPFKYEGKRRAFNAEEGIKELKKYSDTYIIIPNDRIKEIVAKNTPLKKAFLIADDVLRQSIQGISDIILKPGDINVDFADVKSVMLNSGRAVIGMGVARGEDAGIEAARLAISNQLLEETSIQEAKGILINITGGLEYSIESFDATSTLIHGEAHEDANIIIGYVENPELEDEVRVTVIATGIDSPHPMIDIKGVSTVSISHSPIFPKRYEPLPNKRGMNNVNILRKNLGDISLPEGLSMGMSPAVLNESTIQSNEEVPIETKIPDEDMYDTPTLIRRQVRSEKT